MTPTLVKYVGSKAGFLEDHAGLLPMPAPGGAVAVTFTGGGSIAAHYRARGCRVIASDINPRLIGAHVEIQRDVDLVIGSLNWITDAWRKAIDGLEGDERDAAGRVFFETHRAALSAGTGGEGYKHSAFAAARFLFILRAGFNGLYRENSTAECTTAYGKPGPGVDLVQADKLRAYSAAVQGIEFLCEDFAVTCGRCRPGWVASLDSPYEGTFTGYAAGDWDAKQASLPGMGGTSDRERLAAMLVYLDAIGVRWANHDADTAATRRLYERWSFTPIQRAGNVNSNGDDRGSVQEGLWRNWT